MEIVISIATVAAHCQESIKVVEETDGQDW